ncbi:hypothetical protein AAFM46_07045 [Arthrobacter sp. TMP15]|uniref:hypothetical protein n=1 Tax=Arthrobacter sp. TMP15 TaxID=3140789 RepID=UPI0031BB1957
MSLTITTWGEGRSTVIGTRRSNNQGNTASALEATSIQKIGEVKRGCSNVRAGVYNWARSIAFTHAQPMTARVPKRCDASKTSWRRVRNFVPARVQMVSNNVATMSAMATDTSS